MSTAIQTPQRSLSVGRGSDTGSAVSAPNERGSGHSSGKIRLTRRGRVVFTTLAALPIVIALTILGLNAGGAVASSTPVDADFRYVTVASGDTLWQLAVELDPRADPRDVIAEIRDLNQLQTSSLDAGQRLAIPLRFGTAGH
ncbi:LysM peptidoglycan-binding domain-containing protein [Mycetocola tolaasinivorans]|uniref:LysM peptidoglycan-binding domain-containing protein n=1 Tax=Mycetocola tolaasinivorans TaxID=76635 RepID=A0A3L7AEJ9_9MICO|nr:LysM peptidoglycan-binding domain-containing protein [Mycetocola tolaasinivorans]RLP77822.1 LysM peptidoglycan-binding domain-containing protein [Mycetocola tolaasinivorans]